MEIKGKDTVVPNLAQRNSEVKRWILSQANKTLTREEVYSYFHSTLDAEIQSCRQSLDILVRERALLPRAERQQERGHIRELQEQHKKMKASRDNYQQRIGLAFRDLFLGGMVKMSLRTLEIVTFDELKQRAISQINSQIEDYKRLIADGHNDIMTRCWLANLYDYRESAEASEVFRQSDLPEWHRRALKAKGVFVCLGGLTQETWPNRIYAEQNT